MIATVAISSAAVTRRAILSGAPFAATSAATTTSANRAGRFQELILFRLLDIRPYKAVVALQLDRYIRITDKPLFKGKELLCGRGFVQDRQQGVNVFISSLSASLLGGYSRRPPTL
jgi:hypothetical protein